MALSLIRIAVILLTAGAVGGGVAWWQKLPWIESQQTFEETKSVHAQIRQERGVSLERLRELVEQGAVIIDARNPDQFAKAHLASPNGAIPTLNIPPEEFDNNYERLMGLMGYTMVLYCNSATCDLAEELFVRLEESGFIREDLWLYVDGWEGIQKAGLQQSIGADTWKGFDGMTYGDEFGETEDMEGMADEFDADNQNAETPSDSDE